MKTIVEKLENNYFNLEQFDKGQIDFIKSLVKLSYNEGWRNGIEEVKYGIENALENFLNSI